MPLVLIGMIPLLQAQENLVEIAKLQETISKHIDLQNANASEKADWETRKLEMEKLLELHLAELALLEEELSSSGNSAPSHDSEVSELSTKIADLKAARRLTSEAAASAVPRTLRLASYFPEPLRIEITEESEKLRSWHSDMDPRDTIQTIFGILEKAHQFNRKITRSSELIGKVNSDTIYLGLGIAYYRKPQGESGIGRPNKGGWTWEAIPEAQSEIDRALKIVDELSPPNTTQLPLQFEKGIAE